MGIKSFKGDLINGLIWTSGGQFILMIFNLVVNLVLARFISPEEYGLMAITMFFVLIADVLAKGGLSGALIRMKDVSNDDYSTVFIFNVLVSLILYFVLFFSSGMIAEYYENDVLEDLLVITGLVFIFNSLHLINITQLIRTFKFKARFLYQSSSSILSGIIAIWMAYKGYGIWSLVAVPLGSSIFMTLFLIIGEGFKGGLKFSKLSFYKTYSFGVNTSLANLINSIFENIYSLVIGRYFAINQVGYFYQAQKLQNVSNNVLNSFNQFALFPVLSQCQDNNEVFKSIYNKVFKLFTVLVSFLSLLMFLYAEEIILNFLGESWVGSIFYLKVLVVASLFYMIEQLNRVLFKVFDKTHEILKLEIIKKIFQILTILVGLFFANLNYLIYGFVLTNGFSFFINYRMSIYVYKRDIFSELIIIFKVLSCSFICIILFYSSIWYFELFSIGVFFSIPFVIILFFVLLKVFRVVNFQDVMLVVDLIKRKKVS